MTNNCRKDIFFDRWLKLSQLLRVLKALLVKYDEEILAVHAHGCIGDTGDGSKKHHGKGP